MKIITIENYKSKRFPFIAVYRCGKTVKEEVFVRKEFAIERMKARYKKCKIIDKTDGLEKEVV